jgi:hypothetical protein
MRDVDESEVRERLFQLAGEADAAPSLEGRTLRRARRHRALNATATALVAIALVAGSYAAMRAVLSEPPTFAKDPSPTPSPIEPAVDVTGVPDETAETALAIHEGVLTLDFDLLESLLDPMIFVYNLDDGSNPIPEWRRDPTALDTIPAILALPPTGAVDAGEFGTLYIWPYLVHSDMSALTDQERADLASLGLSEEEIDDMIRAGQYLGPRLAIDATGLWRNYVLGGD